MISMSTIREQQRGAVSLFIVIFAALLIMVLTIGFIRMMIQEQKQALNDDLSQSAYDSAVTGVEDAKRVLRACQQDSTSVACTALDAHKCSTITDAQVVSGSGETTIKTNGSSDTSLNQAYTCVKIFRQTDDNIGDLTAGTSKVIRMKATAPFSYFTVEWMLKGKPGGEDSSDLTAPTSSVPVISLPPRSGWSSNSPSLLRVQALLPPNASSVDRAAMDGAMPDPANPGNSIYIASTTFLRPSNVSASQNALGTTASIGSQPRAPADLNAHVESLSPIAVSCSKAGYLGGAYACKAAFKVSYTVPAGSTVAFLRLSSIYRDTSYRVALYTSELDQTLVQFDGVQPLVDSTGRANNVYRRVESRIEPGVAGTGALPYPENAVDVTGSFCKDFYITNTVGSTGVPACSTIPVIP
ncbi:hypothetical protein L336_0665 [Candidatus Saccharimonas aalborgensis]|jgi:Tfp pilus assembly protein PilX|uniref:Uncharacterized protein n=2 Tax=Candidatus Saccharimonas aalborgensis TaxID=1332188 RepID=R4PLA3_9BACT|nr:hypothetical protein L336_0665 [Candidatus Saccharimonas aalborgensis]